MLRGRQGNLQHDYELVLILSVKPRQSWLKKLGPGLVTGAADDDPSGIATYSQAGAQFGLSMLWTVLLTYPLMVGIQIISARIGQVNGRDVLFPSKVTTSLFLCESANRHYVA